MAFRPDTAHFEASRQLHHNLTDKLLNDGQPQAVGSRQLRLWLPTGWQLVMTDYWSFTHREYDGDEQPYLRLLAAGEAVLSCHIEKARHHNSINPNKPVFVYRPDLIKEEVIGSSALRAMSVFTAVGEFTTAAMQVDPPNTIPVFEPAQHDLLKPFLQ